MPLYYQHVWAWFIDLNQARSSGGFGVNPISYDSIDAYFRVMSIEATRDDIQALKILDSLYLEAISEK
ncbi:phage tail assembly chaperone [Ignatzschineria rhizosphaerae]|uniref:phage tail assembly chaperone n=1 Tax=Ignatzschineria rhizosphaerae TaxID=2923279 RepID=UPI003D815D91